EKAVWGKNRYHHRGKMCTAGQQDECNGRFQPLAAGAGIFTTINRGLNQDGASGQQNGVNRSEGGVLSVKGEEKRVAEKIAPAQRPVGLEARREQQSKQSREPDGGGEGIYQQGLLEEIGKRSQHHVAAFCADGPYELNKRPVVLDVPEHIGKEDEE